MLHPAKFLLLALSGIILFSCEEKSPKRSVTAGTAIQKERYPDKSIPQKEGEPKAKKATLLIVKDKSDYSTAFLEDLRKSSFEKIELRDSLLIIEERDTIEFFLTPAFGETVVYTGRKGELVVALTVTRKNYTTLTYHLEMVEYGRANYNEDGEAHISSGFYLGSETDEVDGEMYQVAEYSNHKNDNCDIHIRLSDENQLCKLIKSCNGKIRDINLKNFPALHEK